MEARNFETDMKLSIEAAQQTLAKHPRLSVTGYLTSPYGFYLGPLVLMMREMQN